MSVLTLEGIVEDGRIRLIENVRLPEDARVYVVVPELQVESRLQVLTPHLARPEQAGDFTLEVRAEAEDAGM
jgi:hypothetical protein